MLKEWPKESMEPPFHLSKQKKSQALDVEIYEDCTDLLYAQNFGFQWKIYKS